MNLRNNLLAPIPLILLLWTACDKTEEQINGIQLSGKLRTLTVNAYGQGINTFLYDSDQRLSAIRHKWMLDSIESTKFELHSFYDWKETGDRTNIILSRSRPDHDDIHYYLNSDHFPDSIIRDAYVPGSLQGKASYVYQYDDSRSLTGMLHILSAPGIPDDTSFYYYKQDEQGNIIEEKYTSITWEGNTEKKDEIRLLFEYDNHPNPFHQLIGMETMYGFYGKLIYFNKNNITSVQMFKNDVYVGLNHHFEYLYNRNSFPSQIHVIGNEYLYNLQYY